MYQQYVTVLSLLYLLYCATGLCRGLRSANRVRRIANGLPLPAYDSGYSVTKYFVWISNAHGCAYYETIDQMILATSFVWKIFERFGFQSCSTINPQDVLCGGALLTPKIVQTACHCLASVSQTDQGPIQRFIVQDAFIDGTMTFIGYTSTKDMKRGYVSKLFIIHQKCARHSTTKYIFHDYGIIVLKKSVSADRGSTLSFAPVYKEETMAYMWKKLSSEETVCLFVGYGQLENAEKTYPKVMQYSWGVVRSYAKCYQWTNIKRDGFNYTEDATWLCQTPLPMKQTKPRMGDYGGPVTCQNGYVGLISWEFDDFPIGVTTTGGSMMIAGRSNVSGSSATIFSTWQNAAEYRSKFIQEVNNWDPGSDIVDVNNYV